MNNCSTASASTRPTNTRYFDKSDHNASQIARIEGALDDVAILLLDMPQMLPIFERLEQELETAKRQEDALSRAYTRVNKRPKTHIK